MQRNEAQKDFYDVKIYLDKTKFDELIAVCTKNIEDYPTNTYAYVNRGSIYNAKGDFNQAIADYTKAIEIDSKLAYAYSKRGDSYAAKKIVVEALADYNKALEILPTHVRAYVGRGILYQQQKKFNEAIADFTKTIQLVPNFASAYFQRAAIYECQGKLNEALVDYNKSIELDPKRAIGYFRRGVLYENQAKLNEAVADYSKLIEMDPGHATVYEMRGLIYKSQGKLNEANADFAKVVALDLMQDKEIYSCYNNLQLSYEYTRQIIIDLNNRAERIKMNSNWNICHPTHPTIIIKADELADKKITLESGDVIKVYVVGHCAGGSDIIYSYNNQNEKANIHYEQLTDYLIGLIGKNQAVINLLGCSAGRGSQYGLQDHNSGSSFAAKLHQSLYVKANRDVPVIARTKAVFLFGKKFTLDLNLPEESDRSGFNTFFFHTVLHQPGSKVVYMKQGDDQIKIDAYSYKWKAQVLKTIMSTLPHSHVEATKALLRDWKIRFQGMTPKAIYDAMTSELANPRSALKADCRSLVYRMFSYPETYTAIKSLIDQGRLLFASQFTQVYPIATGRKL